MHLAKPANHSTNKRTPQRPRIRAWLLALALVLLIWPVRAALPAAPQSFVHDTPIFLHDNGELLLKMSVNVDDTDGLMYMLKDGASIKLDIKSLVELPRAILSNIAVAEHTFSSTLRHDPLTREFLLTLPGEEHPRRDLNLARLLDSAWKNLRIDLASLATLRAKGPDKVFQISVTLSLRHTEVPPWLAKTVMFWSWDIVPPETITLEYPPAYDPVHRF